MTRIFWDSWRHSWIYHMLRKESIIGDYFADLLWRALDAIARKRRGTNISISHIFRVNFVANMCRNPWGVVLERGFDELNHPPYFIGQASTDLTMFLKWKIHFNNRRFKRSNEFRLKTERWFFGQNENVRSQGVEKLRERYQLCIEIFGGCAKK